MLPEIPQWNTATHLDDTPTMEEIQHALQQMSSGKAPGVDGIPAEVLKHGGSSLLSQLTDLISKIWEEEAVPQDFKDQSLCMLQAQGRPHVLRQSLQDLSSLQCRQSASTRPPEPA